MKQFLLLFIVSTAFSLLVKAQTNNPPERYLVTIQGDTIRKAPGEFFPIFVKVEMPAQFKGGPRAWHNFLKKNLVYPDSLKSQKIEGKVWLQFIVHIDGRICDLEFLDGNVLLKEAALATMRKSPNWEPANFSGRGVTAYAKEFIVFRLSDEK